LNKMQNKSLVRLARQKDNKSSFSHQVLCAVSI
jgi:hypothetical protein